MNNVSNPKVIVPNGIELNDKDYINSMLSSLKCLVKNYVIAHLQKQVMNTYLKFIV